ncbi:cystatin-B [Oryzias latipes]|uniref:Cystatin-B n=1 Tax=Oryzias latipes TaxID=8090 RepID=A0A3B3HQ41_ORYLA|nr:cystatin-B [Oryzias latipes]
MLTYRDIQLFDVRDPDEHQEGRIPQAVNLPSAAMPLCGGLTETRKADEEIQKICNQVKDRAEGMAGKKFNSFVAISYKTQVMAGISYSIKVHVGGDKYVHVQVWHKRPWNGGELELTNIQYPKRLDDPIQ